MGEMSAIVFEHSLALPFFSLVLKDTPSAPLAQKPKAFSDTILMLPKNF